MPYINIKNCCVRVSQAILELAMGRITGRISAAEPEIFLFVNVSELTVQVCLSPLNLLRRSFRIIKATRCTNFSILFWNKTLHVSDSSSVHHQGFFTAHTAMVHVIQVCWQLASRIRMELQFLPDPGCKLSTNRYDMYHCCVYSEILLMMDRGSVRNM